MAKWRVAFEAELDGEVEVEARTVDEARSLARDYINSHLPSVDLDAFWFQVVLPFEPQEVKT